ncbi:MAG: hypothetical protein IJ779_08790 [Ruminococcus sp.]|nr:hypothetical protein [Ruminococcus sp.]
MSRILKNIAIAAAVSLFACAFTGCGERSAERKIKSAAKSYISEKYGFKPKITDFSFRHAGWLESNSRKKDAGYVTMEHDGHSFEAYISADSPDARWDNYMEAETNERLTGYFSEKLKFDDIYVWATYGGSFIRCGVPADIVTYEDIMEKAEMMCIYVSTVGLDRESVRAMDMSELGEKTEICIVDWKSAEDMRNDDLIMTVSVKPEFDNRVSSCYHWQDGKQETTEF